jgi:hypothetical protein
VQSFAQFCLWMGYFGLWARGLGPNLVMAGS